MLGWAGRPEDSIRLIRRAMRLNPHYPFYYLWTLGHAYYLTGRTGEAVDAFNKVVQQNPNFVPAHAYLAVLFTEMGRTEGSAGGVGEGAPAQPRGLSLQPQAASAVPAAGRPGPASHRGAQGDAPVSS